MHLRDKEAFASVMQGVTELFGKKLSPDLLNLYWRSLQHFEWEDVRKAIELHIMNTDHGSFMPKPADIVRYLEGTSTSKAMMAWNKVVKAIASIGPYYSVVFDDPLIHQVISDMGGWVHLCKMTEDDQPFRAREFENRYSAFLLKPPTTYPRQLTGLMDLHNQSQGYSLTEMKCIGDSNLAKQVYEQGGLDSRPLLIIPHRLPLPSIEEGEN